MMIRAAVALIILAIAACAVLSSYQHKPFPLLVDEAEATSIICNPTVPRDIKQERFKGVQKA